ncbi:hypothetical protein FRC98_18215 [Lujinxingia vulgaris]|uniref:Uncharacterized protein n=1 Tax=Lujinxingia vulgaris TaxID=2600176 RepID=A0A5C6X100_9DELT|nr:hypothetical protein FRC98_18215 [Lujinxingia vulgaris]
MALPQLRPGSLPIAALDALGLGGTRSSTSTRTSTSTSTSTRTSTSTSTRTSTSTSTRTSTRPRSGGKAPGPGACCRRAPKTSSAEETSVLVDT